MSRDTSPGISVAAPSTRLKSIPLGLQVRERTARGAGQRPVRERVAFSCDIPALGLSLIDSVPCELLYGNDLIQGVDYVKKPAIEQEQSLDFSVGRVQLDNQRMHAAFPVVLTPSKVDPWHRKSDEDEGKTMAVRFTLNEAMPNMTVFYQPEIYLVAAQPSRSRRRCFGRFKACSSRSACWRRTRRGERSRTGGTGTSSSRATGGARRQIMFQNC